MGGQIKREEGAVTGNETDSKERMNCVMLRWRKEGR